MVNTSVKFAIDISIRCGINYYNKKSDTQNGDH